MRLRKRTACREAVKLLKRDGIYAELGRGRLKAWLADRWDSYLGWIGLALVVAWFVAARLAPLPRIAAIPADWALSAAATLVPFWAQIAATALGLLIPLTILLAGWLERQPQFRIAFGGLAWRRPVELVWYFLAVLAALAIIGAATRITPRDDLVLCDALVLSPVIAIILALRTGLYVTSVLALLNVNRTARALADRAERIILDSVLHEFQVNAANNVLREECDRVGIACGFQRRLHGTAPHLARRSGLVGDVDLDVLQRLSSIAREAPIDGAARTAPIITLVSVVGAHLQADQGVIAELPTEGPGHARLSALTDRLILWSKPADSPDVRDCLELLRQMATNALHAGDRAALSISMGTMADLVARVSARFEAIGLLFGQDVVSKPFSELRHIRLLAIYLGDLAGSAVRTGEPDLIGSFTYYLFTMLGAAADHGDLMTFTELVGVCRDVYYYGFEVGSPIAKHRPRHYLRDLLDLRLYPALEKWRTLPDDRVRHMTNVRDMIYRSIDVLGDMARMAAERADAEELRQMSVDLSEATEYEEPPVTVDDTGALAEIAREVQTHVASLAGLYGLALTAHVVNRFRRGRIDAAQAEPLLSAVGGLAADIRVLVDALGAAVERVDLPQPITQMLQEFPEYDTRRVYYVDRTTRPLWALAVGVMRGMTLQDEQIVQPPAVPSEALSNHKEELTAIASEISEHIALWEPLIGLQVRQRTESFTGWLDACQAAQVERDAMRRAAALISEQKRLDMEAEAREVAAESSVLRKWLHSLGCVRSSPELDDEHEWKLGFAQVTDKDPFTEEPRAHYVGFGRAFGMPFANRETQLILDGLLAAALTSSAPSLADALHLGLQQVSAYSSPDTVIIPWGLYEECLGVTGFMLEGTVDHDYPKDRLLGFFNNIPVLTLMELKQGIIVASLRGNCVLHDIRPLTLVVEAAVPLYMEAARRLYPDADETQLAGLVRVVLEEKVRFDPPPNDAVAVVEIRPAASPDQELLAIAQD